MARPSRAIFRQTPCDEGRPGCIPGPGVGNAGRDGNDVLDGTSQFHATMSLLVYTRKEGVENASEHDAHQAVRGCRHHRRGHVLRNLTREAGGRRKRTQKFSNKREAEGRR